MPLPVKRKTNDGSSGLKRSYLVNIKLALIGPHTNVTFLKAVDSLRIWCKNSKKRVLRTTTAKRGKNHLLYRAKKQSGSRPKFTQKLVGRGPAIFREGARLLSTTVPTFHLYRRIKKSKDRGFIALGGYPTKTNPLKRRASPPRQTFSKVLGANCFKKSQKIRNLVPPKVFSCIARPMQIFLQYFYP